jgi:Tfp pilus assembly pilus retraction ATPase PilT
MAAALGSDAANVVYPGEFIHKVTKEMADRLMLWAVDEHRVSDVVYSPDDPVWIHVDGVWRTCTTTSLLKAEVEELANEFSAQPQMAGRVQGMETVDFAYFIRRGRGEFQRFRVNVTNSNKGPYIVMRALPTKLPELSDLDLEPGIVEALYPPSGLVIVSGVMGSGKSTLLAGAIHTAIREKGRQILTLEEPIEFDFSSIHHSRRSAPITQSGIGQHVRSWTEGVRTMTRRKGEITMVGEARDRETLESMISSVEQGVTAYSTVHAQDVPQTFTRIVNAFPEEERPSAASILLANLRLVIHQRLVERINRTEAERLAGVPGRIALREFLAFDEGIRMALYKVPYQGLIPAIREMVTLRGQSLLEDAKRKLESDPPSISRLTYEAIRHEQEVSVLAQRAAARDMG